MEKQIEEMAKAMCWEGADCSKCDGLLPCNKMYYAPRLVDKGYRKASEVAREIIGMLREDLRGLVDADYLERLLEIYEKKYTEVGE